MKELWKKYHRYKRIKAKAKWYLENIQPASVSINREYAFYSYLLIDLEQIFGKPEPIRDNMNEILS